MAPVIEKGGLKILSTTELVYFLERYLARRLIDSRLRKRWVQDVLRRGARLDRIEGVAKSMERTAARRAGAPLVPIRCAQAFGVKDSRSMSEKNRIVFRAVPGMPVGGLKL
jgi:hypothetical protein